jgi:hypothetical protein
MLMVLTHNIMILWRVEVFYRAVLTRFRCPWTGTAAMSDAAVNLGIVSRHRWTS